VTAELSLRDQQTWFAIASTHQDDVREGSELASRMLGRPLPIEHCLTDGPSLTAAERLAIYSDGYFARLVECVADDYPALQHCLGVEAFESLARAYIRAFPSRSPSLNAYGSGMAAFCCTRAEAWALFAADLARLEWALVEVIHAPSAPGLAADELSKIPADGWRTARFTPSPTLRLLDFEYPVNDYFQAFREGVAPGIPERHPTSTVVYRRGLPVIRMSLERPAAMLLAELLSGFPLESAVAELERRSRDRNDIVEKLPVWLGTWVANGFFSALEY
jgi:hypothetical protein